MRLPSLTRRGRELHGAHNAFAFLDENQLIDFDIFQSIHLPAGPADFEQLDFVRLAQAKVPTGLRAVTACEALSGCSPGRPIVGWLIGESFMAQPSMLFSSQEGIAIGRSRE